MQIIIARVETNGTWRTRRFSKVNLHVLQSLMGGNLEFFGIYDDIIAYCDEDGRHKKLHPNEPAQRNLSIIFEQQCPTILGPILLSRIDEDGDECGLTPEDLVLLTTRFGPEC
jgi:hypothetical protein